MTEVDYSKVAKVNGRKMRLGHVTLGSASDPCVVISPGGGVTKAMSLFWARELAEAGPFFVVLYAAAYSSFDHSDDDDGEWRAASTLYWLRVLYSLTTFPFLLLTLPVFSKVLTHAERTGFNREGHCVPFQLRPPEPDKLNGGSPMSVVDDAELGGAVEGAARVYNL